MCAAFNELWKTNLPKKIASAIWIIRKNVRKLLCSYTFAVGCVYFIRFCNKQNLDQSKNWFT